MTILKTRKGRLSPFKTETADSAFQQFVSKDGPLGRIFADPTLRLAPAKGARPYREQAKYAYVYDQAYFSHALNVATTAAILFEAADLAEGREPNGREIAVILAAGALHDFNKLPLAGGRSLARALAECSSARSLVENFIDDKEFEDVRSLILSVEETTSRDAADYAFNSLEPRRSARAQLCLTLSDRLMGSFADPNDAEGYAQVVARFRTEHRDFPDIRVQSFTLIPQPALARAARQAFMDWVRQHGTLLHETERYVSWIGPEPTENDLSHIDYDLWTRVQPSPRAAFEKSGIAAQSVPTSWIQSIEPTPEMVDDWIETLGGSLVVWAGNWGIDNFAALSAEFPGVFKYEQKPRRRVIVKLPEKDESAGKEFQSSREMAKLIIAHCILQFKSKERKLPPGDHAPFTTSPLDAVMKATVPGILWARAEKTKPDGYSGAIQAVSVILRGEVTSSPNPALGVVRSVLGSGTLAAFGATGQSCIYCGAAARIGVEDGVIFGFKSTAWAPRKRGVQKFDQRGVICDLCRIENELRDESAREAGVSSSKSGYLTAHIHAADLVCDVRWDALAPLLESPAGDPGEGKLILVGKRDADGGIDAKRSQLVPLRGHVSVPVPKPAKSGKESETLAHLARLRDFLIFARETGFKVHISPLALTPIHERAQFKWTNAPRWIDAMDLAEVHIDDLLDEPHDGHVLPGALRIVNALLTVGWMPVEGKSPRGAHTQLVASLQLDPLSVYSYRDKPTDEVDILGGKFLKPDHHNRLGEIADPYTEFNEPKRWAEQSNAHWTWATRTAIDVMEGAGSALTPVELRDHIVGAVWRQAERKNPYARHEDVERFVDALTGLVQATNDGYLPIGARRRWLIDAIRYRCQKEYLSKVEQSKQSKLVTP